MEEFVTIIVVCISLLVLTCALLLSFRSVWHSLKVNRRKTVENGVPVGIIGWSTFLALLLVSIPTILIFSFTDGILITAGVSMAAAIGCMIYSISHSVHKKTT